MSTDQVVSRYPQEWLDAAWAAVRVKRRSFASDTSLANAVLAALEEVGALRDPSDSETRHMIEFRDDGWTIQHPLACRPNLFDCKVNRASSKASARWDGPPRPMGRYWCGEESGAFEIGSRVEVPDA